MARYAADTSVSSDRSEQEIKRTLRRYGADDIVIGDSTQQKSAFVQFDYQARAVRMAVPLPDPTDPDFSTTPGGRRKRNPAAVAQAWEQACRQNWRILLLLIKAQMEAVDLGIITVDQAFLPWLLLPNGSTVGEHMIPQLTAAREGGKMPKLLAWPGAPGQTREEA